MMWTPSTLEECRKKIRQYVLTSLDSRGVEQIDDGQSLIESGVADSLGIFQLVAFLEGAFHIAIGDHEIVQDNFETIDAVVAFVATKLGRAGAAL